MLQTKNLGFDGLVHQLDAFEAQYGISSADFYTKFLANEFEHENDDELVFWAGLYEMYLRLAPQYEKNKVIVAPTE